MEPVVFSISEDCARLGLRAGIILFRDVTVQDSSEPLRALAKSVAEEVRRQFPEAAALRATPELAAFRRVYEAVGVNPNREVPGCQRLLELAWRRGDLPRVNMLVDTYNLVSAKWRLSIGAHDVATLTLPVSLRLTRGDETFTPLGASSARAVRPGEFAYVDASDRVICRLDLIQAEFSKITDATSAVLAIIEGTAWHDPAAFESARAELVDLVRLHCGGRVETVAA